MKKKEFTKRLLISLLLTFVFMAILYGLLAGLLGELDPYEWIEGSWIVYGISSALATVGVFNAVFYHWDSFKIDPPI